MKKILFLILIKSILYGMQDKDVISKNFEIDLRQLIENTEILNKNTQEEFLKLGYFSDTENKQSKYIPSEFSIIQEENTLKKEKIYERHFGTNFCKNCPSQDFYLKNIKCIIKQIEEKFSCVKDEHFKQQLYNNFNISILQAAKNKANLLFIVPHTYINTVIELMNFFNKDTVDHEKKIKEINTVKAKCQDLVGSYEFSRDFMECIVLLDDKGLLNKYLLLNHLYTLFWDNLVFNKEYITLPQNDNKNKIVMLLKKKFEQLNCENQNAKEIEKQLFLLKNLKEQKIALENEINHLLSTKYIKQLRQSKKDDIISHSSDKTIEGQIERYKSEEEYVKGQVKRLLLMIQGVVLSQKNSLFNYKEKPLPIEEQKEKNRGLFLSRNMVINARLTKEEAYLIMQFFIHVFFHIKKEYQRYLSLKLAYIYHEIPLDKNIFLIKSKIIKLKEDIRLLLSKKPCIESFFNNKEKLQTPNKDLVAMYPIRDQLKKALIIKDFLLNLYFDAHNKCDIVTAKKMLLFLNQYIDEHIQLFATMKNNNFLVFLREDKNYLLEGARILVEFFIRFCLNAVMNRDNKVYYFDPKDNYGDWDSNLLPKLKKTIDALNMLEKIPYVAVSYANCFYGIEGVDCIAKQYDTQTKKENFSSCKTNDCSRSLANSLKTFNELQKILLQDNSLNPETENASQNIADMSFSMHSQQPSNNSFQKISPQDNSLNPETENASQNIADMSFSMHSQQPSNNSFQKIFPKEHSLDLNSKNESKKNESQYIKNITLSMDSEKSSENSFNDSLQKIFLEDDNLDLNSKNESKKNESKNIENIENISLPINSEQLPNDSFWEILFEMKPFISNPKNLSQNSIDMSLFKDKDNNEINQFNYTEDEFSIINDESCAHKKIKTLENNNGEFKKNKSKVAFIRRKSK